jgi:Protein of unknown function (DUF3467)
VTPDEKPFITRRVDVPDDLRGGVYANFLYLWHSPYEFTFDFAVVGLAEPVDSDVAESGFAIPYRVVARIRIPVALVFDILRLINASLANYEATWGEIRRPELRTEDEAQ